MPKVKLLVDGGTRIQGQICPALLSMPTSSIPLYSKLKSVTPTEKIVHSFIRYLLSICCDRGNILDQGLLNFFYKRPDSKYFRLHGLCGQSQ